MMRNSMLFAFAMPLVACSPSGQPVANTTAAVIPAVVAPVRAPEPPAVADTNAAPKPGMLKTFGDWTVGCDNTLRCTLGSLLSETSVAPNLTLNLIREPGRGGMFSLAIDSRNFEAAKTRPPASLAVDGKPFALRDAAEVAAGMANGQSLTVRDANGDALATISLKGAAAALRYVDAQQGRAGSTDAIVAKGPAASRAPSPALPVILAVEPSGIAANLTATQIATIRQRGTCSLGGTPSQDSAIFAPDTHALGGGKTLVILPCSTGAYNMIGALFVVDGSSITPAETDAPAGFDATGADSESAVRSVVNGSFENGVLTSYAKGRGLGDCGVHQSFVWDGTRFRLSEQAEMGECRGNIDYITTWRARVVRRPAS